MARLTVGTSFDARHGTATPSESTFDIEVSISGALEGDFVSGRDDQELEQRIKQEAARLEGQWLDNIVGRATLENIATYLVWRLRDLGVDSVGVALGKKRVIVAVEEIDETYEAECAFKRGVSLAVRGMTEEAVGAFRLAIGSPPFTARAFNGIGRCLRRLGRLEEALENYERAIAVDPTLGEAYRNRGNVLLELGRRQEAIASLTRAVDLMPTSALAHNNRGYAYQTTGALDKALVDHDQAIALDPCYEEAFRDRAAVLMKNGKIELAESDIAHADSIKGGSSDVDIERTKLMCDG